MTPAARLRAMAEKATVAPWAVPHANVHRVIAFNGDEPTCLIVEHPDEDATFGCHDVSYWKSGAEDGGRRSAADRALIVHLHNRAQLYADLIEAATALRDRIERTTNPSYMHQDERVLISALAAIDAADKEGV